MLSRPSVLMVILCSNWFDKINRAVNQGGYCRLLTYDLIQTYSTSWQETIQIIMKLKGTHWAGFNLDELTNPAEATPFLHACKLISKGGQFSHQDSSDSLPHCARIRAVTNLYTPISLDRGNWPHSWKCASGDTAPLVN